MQAQGGAGRWYNDTTDADMQLILSSLALAFLQVTSYFMDQNIFQTTNLAVSWYHVDLTQYLWALLQSNNEPVYSPMCGSAVTSFFCDFWVRAEDGNCVSKLVWDQLNAE